MRHLLFALAVSAALIGIARAQVWIMSPAGGGTATTGAGGTHSGGGTGNDLLANTGQPIYSTGTTPILVQ